MADLLAPQPEQGLGQDAERPLGVAKHALHATQLPLRDIEPRAVGRAHTHGHPRRARDEVDQPQLRMAHDRGGLPGDKRGGEQLATQPREPAQANAAVVEEEEPRGLGRQRQRERAVAGVMDLPLELLEAVQDQPQPLTGPAVLATARHATAATTTAR